jgi:hypothetical protein
MQVVEHLKHMTPDRFCVIYEALQQNGFGPLDSEVAKALKFRPQSIRKLPMVQRARRAKSILESTVNSELTYELFGSYLMKTRKDLITDFLDATGVEHEDGMLSGDLAEQQPSPDKIGSAVKDLDGRFDPEDVTLYLAICAQHWPSIDEIRDTWQSRVQ